MKQDKMSASSNFSVEICLHWSRAKTSKCRFRNLGFQRIQREHLYVYFKCQITRKSATNPQYNQYDQKIDGSLQNASHSWLANNCCEW